MSQLLDEILNSTWVSIEVTKANLLDEKKKIPNTYGLYSISTNTPKDILTNFSFRSDKKHYNFKKKISQLEFVPSELLINQINDEMYCVYNGHHSNLRQRLSEHFIGSKGTACLAFFEFEELCNFKWSYDYLALNQFKKYSDSKLFRVCLEQYFRVKSKWPILCSQ